MSKGLLVVISGPAGVGKGTVIGEILHVSDEYVYSVSATTRTNRPGEVHGKHYYFITRGEFEQRINDGEMLEYAEYVGNFYGTPKKEVEQWLEEGHNVILEIEVEGALQVKRKFPECVLIFVLPPSIEELEARLRGRGTEDEQTIKRRLDRMRAEIKLIEHYEYSVLNEPGGFTRAAQAIMEIVASKRNEDPDCQRANKHRMSREKAIEIQSRF